MEKKGNCCTFYSSVHDKKIADESECQYFDETLEKGGCQFGASLERGIYFCKIVQEDTIQIGSLTNPVIFPQTGIEPV